jgi:hypothetical protein
MPAEPAGKEERMSRRTVDTYLEKEKRGAVGTNLLSVEELERRSDISRHTWRVWIAKGYVPAVRLGRRVRVAESFYERLAAGKIALPIPIPRTGGALRKGRVGNGT